MTLTALGAIRFPTADLERRAAFYAGLGFRVGARTAISAAEMQLLGIAGAGTRLSLYLGAQQLDLDRFEPAGAPFPTDVGSADTGFQHIAIVTDDAAAAWARAAALGATPISRGGPITLPASSGGVTAIKLRDPEGQPLEFLQFPPGSTGWRGQGLLGIDHSAIAVGDIAASRRFFEAQGLRVQQPTVNRGPTQDALDGLDGAIVDVVPMAAAEALPHLELLGYRQPAPHRRVPAAPGDRAAVRIVWSGSSTALLRDPDGHLHQVLPG